jgi:hypothetical protein
MDICPLAPGRNEHVARLGIERKGLRKNGKNLTIFWGECAPLPL